MNTQIASKITALGVALLMNCLIISGAAYLFDSQSHPQSSTIALARASAQSMHEAT
jgi:hypothetical protein